MKKKYFVSLLIVLFLIVGYLFFKDMIKKNIIVLKDGTAISADETWQVGDKVFYKNKDRIDFVIGENVENIEVKYHLVKGKRKLIGILFKDKPGRNKFHLLDQNGWHRQHWGVLVHRLFFPFKAHRANPKNQGVCRHRSQRSGS